MRRRDVTVTEAFFRNKELDDIARQTGLSRELTRVLISRTLCSILRENPPLRDVLGIEVSSESIGVKTESIGVKTLRYTKRFRHTILAALKEFEENLDSMNDLDAHYIDPKKMARMMRTLNEGRRAWKINTEQ